MDQERIGKLIKDIRKKNNLSQGAFAKKYGVPYQAVSKWENGKNIPDLSIIKQICSDYDISIESLLDGTTKRTKENKTLVALMLFIIGIITIALGILFLTIQSNNKDKNLVYIGNDKYYFYLFIIFIKILLEF